MRYLIIALLAACNLDVSNESVSRETIKEQPKDTVIDKNILLSEYSACLMSKDFSCSLANKPDTNEDLLICNPYVVINPPMRMDGGNIIFIEDYLSNFFITSVIDLDNLSESIEIDYYDLKVYKGLGYSCFIDNQGPFNCSGPSYNTIEIDSFIRFNFIEEILNCND